jgi:GntR family transcriptional regulator
VIEFRIDGRSGVAPYFQLVQQVRGALRLGLLQEGDQLPTVKDVVAQVAINPNTVLKAYRALEHEGLVAGRPGVGTFVTKSLARVPGGAHRLVARSLARWVVKARGAGLLDDDIRALLESTLRAERVEGVA